MQTSTGFTFEGQKEGEHLLIFTRQHWYLLIGPVIGASLMGSIIPLAGIIAFASILADHPGASRYFLFGWMVYLMCIWLFLAYKLTMHALNTWIITDSRILDIWQKGLYNREISELHLESIQDISVHISGIMQSYLNFGNIDIQTAATDKNFTFEDVPNPVYIKDTIMSAADTYVQKYSRNDVNHL